MRNTFATCRVVSTSGNARAASDPMCRTRMTMSSWDHTGWSRPGPGRVPEDRAASRVSRRREGCERGQPGEPLPRLAAPAARRCAAAVATSVGRPAGEGCGRRGSGLGAAAAGPGVPASLRPAACSLGQRLLTELLPAARDLELRALLAFAAVTTPARRRRWVAAAAALSGRRERAPRCVDRPRRAVVAGDRLVSGTGRGGAAARILRHGRPGRRRPACGGGGAAGVYPRARAHRRGFWGIWSPRLLTRGGTPTCSRAC